MVKKITDLNICKPEASTVARSTGLEYSLAGRNSPPDTASHHYENSTTAIYLDLEENEIKAYEHLVATGGRTREQLSADFKWSANQVQQALVALQKAELLATPDAGRQHICVAIHPEVLRLRRTRPLSDTIAAWQAQLNDLQAQLDAITLPSASRADYEGIDSIVTVTDGDYVSDALAVTSARHAQDILVMSPSWREASTMAQHMIASSTRILSKRARVRVLFPHTSRYDAEARDLADQITASGGEVRTTASPLHALAIFDSTEALLLDSLRETKKAHIVRHDTLLGFIACTAENAWSGSEVFQGASGSKKMPESLSQDMKIAIIKLLATGCKDEVVAKRLGIAVRTCRKYIADIYSDFGVQSRFQAGWIMRDIIAQAELAETAEERKSA
ncbi:MAG: hypothetical protein ACRC20_04900 [Segniliparus sp.]|uniref:hypothetical protein n=1 Tax=Segniliparus sp. TaxID=2804064 RepID=UPI003F3D533A